jgi:hypothetical protein
MAALYSTKFYEAFYVPAGSASSGPVPDGFVWVVRDIDLTTGGEIYAYLGGISIFTDVGGPLYQVYAPGAYGASYYAWRGRQVLEAGDRITLATADSVWIARISGYTLSAAS